MFCERSEKTSHYIAEFASRGLRYFRNYFIEVDRLNETVIQIGRHYDTFVSAYLYSDNVFDYLNNNRRNGRSSIANYPNTIDANFLFLDIDSRSLEKSQNSVQRLVDFLYDNWGLSDYAVTSYFSGSKGFHVLLDTRIFGDKIKPNKNLHLIHSAIRRRIPRLAGIDESLIDQSVCAKTQLIRVNNTRNSKSGLYKIYLEPHEVFDLSIEEIKDMARTLQLGRYTNDSGLVPVHSHRVEPIDQAVKLYEKVLSKVGSTNFGFQTKRLKTGSVTNDFRPLKGAICEACYSIFDSNIPEGNRNNTAFVLASSMRSSRYSKDNARELILKWNVEKCIGLPERELDSIINSAYRTQPYSFGCNNHIIKNYCPYFGKKEKKRCKFYRDFLKELRNG